MVQVSRAFVIAALLIAALAATYVARLTIFMFDPSKADYSVLPARPFFRGHSCLTSYTEAARLAPSGVNIFDISQYATEPRSGQFEPRYIGRFEVDLYQYPPAFLVLPAAASTVGLDFFQVRKLWFVMQAALLVGVMLLLARWVGGRQGLLALLLIPAVWLAPTTRVTLQIGNFQATALPLAVLAMMAFARRSNALGGLALGFATVSKIFPGVLGIILLFGRQWRAVVWTALAGIAIAAAAVVMVGTTPFVDFVRYQLPRIESGDAFFWIEDPQMAPVNHSIYGLVTKLRLLGVPATGRDAANAASSAYAVLLLPLAVIGARRSMRLEEAGLDASLGRLRQAQIWLGLLNLASLRSPFVPDAYGYVGTLWLLTLVAAERQRPLREWLGFAALAAAFSIVLDGGVVPVPVPAWMVLATLTIQIVAIAANAWVVITAARRSRPSCPRTDRRSMEPSLPWGGDRC